jgi:hypothetical protein
VNRRRTPHNRLWGDIAAVVLLTILGAELWLLAALVG